MRKRGNLMNKQIKSYLRKIQALIVFRTKDEKHFIKMLQKNIEHDIENGEVKSYQDLLMKYGSPQDIASDYVKSLDEAQIMKGLRLKKIMVICSSIIVVSVLSVSLYRSR